MWSYINYETQLLLDKRKRLKSKRQVPIEEKLDETSVRLQDSPQKSLTCLAQETGVSKILPLSSIEPVKFRPFKTNSARITAMWSCQECM
jgi:hypothetical protein